MKNLRKSKQTKTDVDLSKPFDLPVVDGDCFGKLYDITTSECGVCHDNIVCCTIFSKTLKEKIKSLKMDSFVDEIYFENLDKDEIRGMLKTNDINDVIDIIAEETNCKSKGLIKLWLRSL